MLEVAERDEGESKERQADRFKFSQRLESQHQEKTLLLRGAALASLFTIHKIQVSLSHSVQAFHISVVVRQTPGSSPALPLSLWFPDVETWLHTRNTLSTITLKYFML